jgi:mannose-6-phosphate isomerase-like protein (cupin superfamily)
MSTRAAIPPTEDEHLRFGGVTIVIRASSSQTGGAMTVFEEIAPLVDTRLHVHAHEDELFHVLEGEHEFRRGDERILVGPGELVFLPRRVPHAHRRVIPGRGRLFGVATPGGFDGFFRMLAHAERDGAPPEETFAAASARYGITWLE